MEFKSLDTCNKDIFNTWLLILKNDFNVSDIMNFKKLTAFYT